MKTYQMLSHIHLFHMYTCSYLISYRILLSNQGVKFCIMDIGKADIICLLIGRSMKFTFFNQNTYSEFKQASETDFLFARNKKDKEWVKWHNEVTIFLNLKSLQRKTWNKIWMHVAYMEGDTRKYKYKNGKIREEMEKDQENLC